MLTWLLIAIAVVCFVMMLVAILVIRYRAKRTPAAVPFDERIMVNGEAEPFRQAAVNLARANEVATTAQGRWPDVKNTTARAKAHRDQNHFADRTRRALGERRRG